MLKLTSSCILYLVDLSCLLKLEWLVYDELLSLARELAEDGQPVSPSLLQSVAAHVQGSKTPNCLTQQVPLKFIPGLHGAGNIDQFHQVSGDDPLTS